MQISNLARYAFGIAAGAALLAGCSTTGTQPAIGGSGQSVPQVSRGHHDLATVQKLFAMTNFQHKYPEHQHIKKIKSWMQRVPKGTQLVYVSDVEYGTVDVINYKTGALVGQATGFEYPYGSCSDKHGNVYVTDFDLETATELQAGGTTAINSWATGGLPIGCSVDKKGDLAVTNFETESSSGLGNVIVFAGGGPSGTTYSGPGLDWPAGYDKKGDLFVESSDEGACPTPCLAELVDGSWQVLSYDQTINFPASVELMGKTLGVGDQDGGGPSSFDMAIYATTVSGSTATNKHTTLITDTCYASEDYVDFVSWGNVSKKPNGLQTRKVKAIVGTNADCFPTPLNTWAFPAGGNPKSSIPPWEAYSYGYSATITST
jgi:hypothetical protein